ncbi:MAG: hypothetical protein IJH39_05175 [Clostridia bacterium]|nr:hypothetical protein [Clostridia bacterium]
MKEENIKKIASNVHKLFDIMNSDTKYMFVKKLSNLKGSKGSISDNINSCNDVELIELIKVIMKGKFTEDPKQLFSEILEIVKSETKK